jgi:hypothetical protein
VLILDRDVVYREELAAEQAAGARLHRHGYEDSIGIALQPELVRSG